MTFGPGLIVSGVCAAGYGYWRFSFRQVTEAIRLERAGRLDEARQLLQQFLVNRNPVTRRGYARQRALLLLARLERKAGRYDQAITTALDVARSDCPVGVLLAALQVVADARSWQGDLEAALSEATGALREARKQQQSRFESEFESLICRVLIWQGKLGEAANLATELAQNDGPTSFYGRLRLAEIDRLRGDFESALGRSAQLFEELSRNSENCSDSSASGSGAGEIRMKGVSRAGRPGAAAVWRALAAFSAARATFVEGADDLALQWLERSSPESLPTSEAVGWWGIRSVLMVRRGEDQSARTARERVKRAAEQAAPGYHTRSWARYYLGRILLEENDFRAAREALEAAIGCNPSPPALAEMTYWLGVALDRMPDERSEQVYNRGLLGPPDYWYTQLCGRAVVSPSLGVTAVGELGIKRQTEETGGWTA